MADVPQFDLPPRFLADGRMAEVEQDSLDEIANCVEAALRTRVGDRSESPRYGTPDTVFMEQPIPESLLVAQVQALEPRARILIEQDRDRFDATLVNLGIQVTKGA